MRTVNFTEFRNNASLYLSEVENGGSIRIVRHGKTIAEITPPSSIITDKPLWKRKGLKLTAKGKSLSSAILGEREKE